MSTDDQDPDYDPDLDEQLEKEEELEALYGRPTPPIPKSVPGFSQQKRKLEQNRYYQGQKKSNPKLIIKTK